MALFSASDFTGYWAAYAIPSGTEDVIFSVSVDLILSTGIVQQVLITWNNNSYVLIIIQLYP